MTKRCGRCLEDKELTEFRLFKRSSDGRQSYCKDCFVVYQKAWTLANPDKAAVYGRRRSLKQRHSMTEERFMWMERQQGGVCAICKKAETAKTSGNGDGTRRLSIDHDHRCCPGREGCGKCVRALLCALCNNGLGAFQDDPAILRTAADYLDAHNRSLVSA